MTDASLSRAERNKQQLRAEIIQAAFAEFSARGYHQTGIADIAKRLGIGHGTFYRHFENKRDILEHVINEVSRQIMETLAAENAPGAAGSLAEYREQCRRIGNRFVAVMAENPDMIRMVLFEATSVDAEMTGRIMMLQEFGARITAEYLAHGVKLGFLRADLDAEATSHAVIGMLLGGALRFLYRPDDLDGRQRLVDATLGLLIDGVAKQG